MTPEAPSTAVTSQHTVDNAPVAATLQTIEERTRAVSSPAAERFSLYALKAYMLPRLYWHGMLRGRA